MENQEELGQVQQSSPAPLEQGQQQVDQQQVDQQQQERAAIEAEARKQNWLPREEFRGSPEDWVDANEYVKRGDPRYLREVLGRTEKSQRESQKRLDELSRQANERERLFQEQFTRLERMGEVSLQRQRDQLLSQIEAQKRSAVESGDTAAYDRLSSAEQDVWKRDSEVRKEFAPPRQARADSDDPRNNPAVQGFRQRNSWFEQDPVLNLEAQAIHMDLRQRSPYMPLDDNLRKVEEEIKRRHPQKFGIQSQPSQQNGSNGQAPRGPSVEGGGRMASSGAANYAARLDSVARAQADRDVKRGLYQNVEEWARVYYNS
jgi:hypothetical protein